MGGRRKSKGLLGGFRSASDPNLANASGLLGSDSQPEEKRRPQQAALPPPTLRGIRRFFRRVGLSSPPPPPPLLSPGIMRRNTHAYEPELPVSPAISLSRPHSSHSGPNSAAPIIIHGSVSESTTQGQPLLPYPGAEPGSITADDHPATSAPPKKPTSSQTDESTVEDQRQLLGAGCSNVEPSFVHPATNLPTDNDPISAKVQQSISGPSNKDEPAVDLPTTDPHPVGSDMDADADARSAISTACTESASGQHPMGSETSSLMPAATGAQDTEHLISTDKHIRDSNFAEGVEETALHKAVENGHTGKVEPRLKEGAGPNNKDQSSVDLPTTNPHPTGSDMDTGTDASSDMSVRTESGSGQHPMDSETSSLMPAATEAQDTEHLISTDKHIRDNSFAEGVEETALHKAVENGYTDKVELLLEEGASIEAIDEDNNTDRKSVV